MHLRCWTWVCHPLCTPVTRLNNVCSLCLIVNIKRASAKTQVYTFLLLWQNVFCGLSDCLLGVTVEIAQTRLDVAHHLSCLCSAMPCWCHKKSAIPGAYWHALFGLLKALHPTHLGFCGGIHAVEIHKPLRRWRFIMLSLPWYKTYFSLSIGKICTRFRDMNELHWVTNVTIIYIYM